VQSELYLLPPPSVSPSKRGVSAVENINQERREVGRMRERESRRIVSSTRAGIQRKKKKKRNDRGREILRTAAGAGRGVTAFSGNKDLIVVEKQAAGKEDRNQRCRRQMAG